MKYLLSFLMLPMAVTTLAQQIREVTSPDGSVRLNIYDGTALSYMVTVDNKLLIEPSPIDLVLDNGTHFGGKPVIRKTKLTRHNDIITSPVPEKRRLIPDRYNQLTLQLAQPFSVIFRVYDEGKLSEVFASGTAAVISPVGELGWKDREIVINDGKIGTLSQKLYDMLSGIQLGKLEDKFEWTVEVEPRP